MEYRREQALAKPLFDEQRQVFIRPLAGLQKGRDPMLLAKYTGTVEGEQVPRYLLIYVSNSQTLKGPAFLQTAERALARSVGRASWSRPAKVGQKQVDGRTMVHYRCPVRMTVAHKNDSGTGTTQITAQMQFWVYAYERDEAAPAPTPKGGKPAPRAWRVLVAYACHSRQDVKESFAEAQNFSIETLRVGNEALAAWEQAGGEISTGEKKGKGAGPMF